MYRQLIEELGVERARRQLGIRIRVDRVPTHEELHAMTARSGLSVVWVDVEDDTQRSPGEPAVG